MKTRAERRHHHKRMLERVKSFVLYKFGMWSEEEKIKHQKKTAENRKPCSCHMCGNPRHVGKDKLTMQEKRALQKIEDDDVQL